MLYGINHRRIIVFTDHGPQGTCCIRCS